MGAEPSSEFKMSTDAAGASLPVKLTIGKLLRRDHEIESPLKWLVSMSKPEIEPVVPNFTIHLYRCQSTGN